MILEVYDLECLSNLFTYTGFDCKEKKYYQFVISSWRNDFNLLINHLKRDKLIQVGFNNLSYDYPLIHHLLNHQNLYKYKTGQEIAVALYSKSQEIINMEFSEISEENVKILDFSKEIIENPNYLMADGIHLTKEGNDNLNLKIKEFLN